MCVCGCIHVSISLKMHVSFHSWRDIHIRIREMRFARWALSPVSVVPS